MDFATLYYEYGAKYSKKSQSLIRNHGFLLYAEIDYPEMSKYVYSHPK